MTNYTQVLNGTLTIKGIIPSFFEKVLRERENEVKNGIITQEDKNESVIVQAETIKQEPEQVKEQFLTAISYRHRQSRPFKDREELKPFFLFNWKKQEIMDRLTDDVELKNYSTSMTRREVWNLLNEFYVFYGQKEELNNIGLMKEDFKVWIEQTERVRA